MRQDRFSGLLKLFERFDNQYEFDATFEYDLNNVRLKELRNHYKLDELIEGDDELTAIIHILNWVSTSCTYDGTNGNQLDLNSINILDYLENYKGKGVNCRCLATVLAECLLAIGVKARVLHLIPMSPYDMDNHVVVMAYLASKNKWIYLDPTYNCYITDDKAEVLSPLEIRTAMANLKSLDLGAGFITRDGTIVDGEFKSSYLEYISKNIFAFKCVLNNSFQSETDLATYVCLCPEGYNITDVLKLNREYRASYYQDRDALNAWLSENKNTPERMKYISLEQFISCADIERTDE